MKNKGVWVVARILLGLVIASVGIWQLISVIDKQHTENEIREEQEQIAISTLKSGYEQLEIGMTYEDCVSVLGSEGELFSETESEYFGKFAIYLWKPENTLFTGIEAHFDNGELSSKTWLE